jgi:hypothetical protein
MERGESSTDRLRLEPMFANDTIEVDDGRVCSANCVECDRGGGMLGRKDETEWKCVIVQMAGRERVACRVSLSRDRDEGLINHDIRNHNFLQI